MRTATGLVLLDRLHTPGIALAARSVTSESASLLLPEERASLKIANAGNLARSAAARCAARDALRILGLPGHPIRRAPDRSPVWPDGVTGSLAHVEDIAIAAVAGAANAIGLGVDIEPDTPLPEGVAEIVATVAERARYSADIIGSRTLFVVKEAVFKAVHPSDGVFLEHDAIDVDLDSGVATIAYGRIVPFKVARARHIIALAIIA